MTKGREVENYIPANVVADWLQRPQNKVQQVGQYEYFFDYLETLSNGAGKRFVSKKPLLAEELASRMTCENIREVLDLGEKLEDLCATIRRWNS